MQTALQVSERDSELRIAMVRLLHRLRAFMSAYPVHEDDKMPEHDVVWFTEVKTGPAETILEAIKMQPELWAHAIPEDCCIVPREMLKRAVANDVVCEALGHHGAHAVATHAARLRYEAEEAALRKATTMTPEEREAFYDKEVAPALLAVSKRCEGAGMSIVATVEWAPEGAGSTFALAEGSSFAIRLVKLAAEVRGNVDGLIIALRKYDPTGGGSVFLRVLNQRT